MGMLNDLLYTNKTGKLAIKALDIYAQKALLITSNIANVETPGYKEVSIKPFEQALKQAFKPTVAMAKTHKGHIGGGNSLKNFQPEVVTSKEPGRLDGNNVNLDRVMIKMTENTMMYNAVIAAAKKRGQIISASIEAK
jgi:flagellar basal-body rod protein FlgB